MAIPDYLSNVDCSAITGGAGSDIERVKNLSWSYPDGTILEDGNDNLEKPEFIRVVKSGRVEFSFECRNVEAALAEYNSGGCTSIAFVESNAKDTQDAVNKMTVTFNTNVQWMGIEHNVAWGELASTTLRGAADTVTVA